MWTGKTVSMTAESCFIGSILADWLTKLCAKARVVDDLSSGRQFPN
jgi:hypothetical protein